MRTRKVVAGVGALVLAAGFGGVVAYPWWERRCAARVGSAPFRLDASAARVADVRDYCDEAGSWRGWVLRPADTTDAAAVQREVVGGLLADGWGPMSWVPPVAAGFRSLCRDELYATVFTASQADRAEKAQLFVDTAPLRAGDVEVAVGRNDDCRPAGWARQPEARLRHAVPQRSASSNR